jgi:hypothetical protein
MAGMTDFIAIDSRELTTITGGGDARTRMLDDALNNRFGDDGAVKLLGPPKYSSAGHGVSHATGRVDINALSGGDTKRSFTADVDPRHHRVTNLHTKLISFE